MTDQGVNFSLKKDTKKLAMLSPIRKHSFIIAFTALSLFYVITSTLWFRIDQRPPRWDESHLLMISQYSYQSLQKGDILRALDLHNTTTTKPGLIPFLSACSYFLLGDSEYMAAFLVNVLSMLLIFYSILRLSKDLTDRIDFGVIAALLFCNVPAVLVFSGYYQVELPITALVCYTICLFWAIDKGGFQNKGLSILLGLTIMIGIGTKHLYVVIICAPLTLLLYRSLILGKRPFRINVNQRLHLLISLALGTGIGILYHVYNFHIIQEQLARSKDVILTGGTGTPPTTWDVFIDLLSSPYLPSMVWVILFCLVVMISLVWKKWQIAYLLLCIAGGYTGVYYVASWPVVYYFLPFLPLFFLICFIPMGFSVPIQWRLAGTLKRGRDIAVFTIISILALHYMESRLGTKNIFHVILKLPKVLLASEPLRENPFSEDPYWKNMYVDGNRASLPYPHYWPVKNMLSDVTRAIGIRPNPRLYRLAFLTDYEWMTKDLLAYKVWQLHLQRQLGFVLPLPPPEDKTIEQFLMDYDFLIIKTGDIWKKNFYTDESARRSQAFVDKLTFKDYALMRENRFELLQRYRLPDGSEGSVWVSPAHMSLYSLIDSLPFGETSISDPGYFAQTWYRIDNDQRRVFLQHPVPAPRVSEIRWRNLQIKPGSHLDFGITLSPDVWLPDHGDGVEFAIDLVVNGERINLFNQYIDPKNNPNDRHWKDYKIPLEANGAKNVDLILITKPGPANNANYDHAGWSGLFIKPPM
jgi:hypothetical protein